MIDSYKILKKLWTDPHEEPMTISRIAEMIANTYPESCIAELGDLSVYKDSEDILVDYLMDFFFYDLLDFCGCGCKEDTQEVIRRVLNIRNLWAEGKLDYSGDQQRYREELGIDTQKDIEYGVLQFMLYTLDSKGILEHGSGIGGSWLTPLGKMYLTVLNAWRSIQDEG